MRVESQGMTVVSVVGEIVFVMTTTDPGMLEVMIVPGIVVMIVNPGTVVIIGVPTTAVWTGG